MKALAADHRAMSSSRTPWPPRRRSTLRHQNGFTLVEVVVALAFVGAAALGSIAVTLTSLTAERVQQDAAAATMVARQVLERLDSVPFQELFARFNTDASDDPAGPCPGAQFEVRPYGASGSSALASTNSQESPMQVVVAFPVDAAGHLTEMPTAGWSGETFDMDGDGAVNAGPLAASYQVLPVQVSVTWTAGAHTRTVQARRFLTPRSVPRVGQEYLGLP